MKKDIEREKAINIIEKHLGSSFIELEGYVEYIANAMDEYAKFIRYSNKGKERLIPISEDIYEFLVNLSNEIKEQDNRCTRMPYFFQVREKELVGVPDGCGKEAYVLDGDVISSPEDIKIEIFEYKDWTFGDEIDENNYLSLSNLEIDNIMRYAGWRKINIDYIETYSNCFLTEKSAKDYIEKNKHNLRNPQEYLRAAQRNIEMEKLFDFLVNIT